MCRYKFGLLPLLCMFLDEVREKEQFENDEDNKQLDKALAMFINAYWQDLTTEEQEQIREILE